MAYCANCLLLSLYLRFLPNGTWPVGIVILRAEFGFAIIPWPTVRLLREREWPLDSRLVWFREADCIYSWVFKSLLILVKSTCLIGILLYTRFSSLFCSLDFILDFWDRDLWDWLVDSAPRSCVDWLIIWCGIIIDYYSFGFKIICWVLRMKGSLSLP